MRDVYEFGPLVNRGLSAEVYEGTSRLDGSKAALKVYVTHGHTAAHQTITEHVCMSRCASKHVLQSYGVMLDRKRPTLILQLADQSLRDFLQACQHLLASALSLLHFAARSPNLLVQDVFSDTSFSRLQPCFAETV